MTLRSRPMIFTFPVRGFQTARVEVELASSALWTMMPPATDQLRARETRGPRPAWRLSSGAGGSACGCQSACVEFPAFRNWRICGPPGAGEVRAGEVRAGEVRAGNV